MQFHAYPLIAVAAGFAVASSAVAQEAQAPAEPSAIEAPDTDVPQTEADAPENEAADEPDAAPVEPSKTAPVEVEPSSDTPATGTTDALEQADAPAAPSAMPEAPASPTTESTAPADADAAPSGVAPAGTAIQEPAEVVRDTFGSWEVRCIADGSDCFMYQLALDADDNPVAEVSMLKLPSGGDAQAGVTVVTPLGTLLPEGVTLQIDGGERRSFPFTWCSQVGCFARFGLNEAAIGTMKRGNVANMTVVSIGDPEAPISVQVALDGFTSAYDSLEAPQ